MVVKAKEMAAIDENLPLVSLVCCIYPFIVKIASMIFYSICVTNSEDVAGLAMKC